MAESLQLSFRIVGPTQRPVTMSEDAFKIAFFRKSLDILTNKALISKL